MNRDCFSVGLQCRAILQEQGLGNDRRGGAEVAPGKPNRPDELTGPNQCWCWDISYLKDGHAAGVLVFICGG